jgi:hypothetical protein
MERPVTVRAGLGAFIAEIVLGLVGSAYSFTHFDELMNRSLARAAEQASSTVPVTASDLRGFLVLGVVIGLIIIAAELLFIWFAWKGRNWARIVLWVLAGLTAVFGVVNLGSTGYLPGFVHGLSICQWVLSLAAIILLAQKPANEWYRYRKWLRATGQRG